MLTKIGLAISVITVFSSCQKQNQSSPYSVNGVWESIGSGWILEIKDSTAYSFYDITSISCLPRRQGEFEDISTSLNLLHDTLSLLVGPITYQFAPIADIPKLCQADLTYQRTHDPIYNFEVFSETVKEHYAFLELNGIDWDKLYTQQKKKLSSNSSDSELYLLIEDTLEKLNDNHAFLEATDSVYDELDKLAKEDESEESFLELGDLPVAEMVAQHHLQEEMTEDSWLIQWGKLTDDLGYVLVKTMWLYADLEIPQSLIGSIGFVDAYIEIKDGMYEGDYIEKEVKGVSKIMDQVMHDLTNSGSIVIDIRFNGGGQDVVSFEILSRFIPEKLQIGIQKLRYGNHHTSILPLFIDARKNAYTKPVYVLTSSQTGSAAESFSLATMSVNHIKRIGSSTTGALSTTLDKELPNGWVFSISNEVFMDNNGKFYENIGIPPNYEIDYSRDRQTFFKSVIGDLDADKKNILAAIKELNDIK